MDGTEENVYLGKSTRDAPRRNLRIRAVTECGAMLSARDGHPPSTITLIKDCATVASGGTVLG